VMTMSKKKMTTSITFFDGFVAKKWWALFFLMVLLRTRW
jgi:hypothetical protein